MKNIELIASRNFNDFAAQQQSNASWAYLSKPRQLAWVKEVLFQMQWALGEIETAIPPPAPNLNTVASFERGVEYGIQMESRRLQAKFKELKDILDSQFERISNAGK